MIILSQIYIRMKRLIFMFSALTVLFVACNKQEEDRPVGTEPINFITPDSTTIFASAGEVVDFSLYLSIDQAIDSIRGAYFIDTAMTINNLTYADMSEEFYVEGFMDSLNVQTVSSVFTMPSGRTDSTLFRPYFSGSTTPFIAPQYDAVRIVFRLEAEDNTSYEKQLKIIVQ